MDERTRALIRLSASLTADEATQVQAMDRAAAVDMVGAEEVLLQSYLFLGFPVALNALSLWRRRVGRTAADTASDHAEEQAGRRAAGKVSAPLESEDLELWQHRGEAVCRAVYADHYETLREVMARIHPELGEWAVVEGYGKVLGRPGLDLYTRELCIASLLAGTNATRQIHSHLRGCLHVGASPADVDGMLEALADVIAPERARETQRVWARVRARWNGNQGS
jgi:4-carboxymuconolactone decarboxylase